MIHLLQTTVFGYHYSDSPCSPVEPIPREDRRERLENRRLKRAYRFCWNPPCALGSKRKDCSCSPAATPVYPVVPPRTVTEEGASVRCPGKCPGSPLFHSHNAERYRGSPPFHSPHSRRVPCVRTSVRGSVKTGEAHQRSVFSFFLVTNCCPE
jgi:hypothetical protein